VGESGEKGYRESGMMVDSFAVCSIPQRDGRGGKKGGEEKVGSGNAVSRKRSGEAVQECGK